MFGLWVELCYIYTVIKIINKIMKVSELKSTFSVFGNKGNVWSNNAHIYQSGKGNLCGTPALSTNHAHIMGLEEANCEKCNEAYSVMFGSAN
jgi:hypothetical protein